MNDKNSLLKEERIISIALWKAIGVLVLAVIGAAGAGIWGGMVTLNSDHFSIVALQKEVDGLDNRYMPLALSLEKWKNNDERHTEIIRKIDNLTSAVNNLYKK